MITGSLVALITPLTLDGSIDKQKLDELVEYHIAQGTHGIVAVGTTGESATLTYDEHADVIRQVVEKVNGRVPVIAGTGANSTHEAIDLTQRAKEAGADACLLVVPYYNRPTQEGMYLHFKAIAEAVDIPQILYNVPGRTVADMSNETTLRLASISNIVGIKESTSPYFELEEEFELQETTKGLIENGLINAAHDCADGGLFIAMTEMGMPNKLGFDIVTDAEIREDAFLFGEAQSRVVVTINEDQEEEFIEYMMNQSVPYTLLGHVTKGKMCVDDEHYGYVNEIKDVYDNALEKALS